jgi:hypothetical protein
MSTLLNVLDGGSVEDNDLTAIKSSGQVSYHGTLDIGTDYLRIYSDSLSADRSETVTVAHGTYLVSVTQRTLRDTTSEGTAELYSLLLLLDEDVTPEPYSVPAGTVAVTRAAEIVRARGLKVQADSSTAALTAPMTFDAGIKWLDVVNDLLSFASVSSAGIDAYGTVLFRRYVDPSALTPVITFRDSVDGAHFAEGVVWEFDTSAVPNKVVAIKSSQDSVMTAVAINDDPRSRDSTVSRGRTFAATETVNDIEDQAALDALAQRLLVQKTSAVESLEVEHPYQPFDIGVAGRLIYKLRDTDFVGVSVRRTLTLSKGLICKTRFRRFVRM